MTTVTTPTGGYIRLTIDPALEQVAETVGGAEFWLLTLRTR